MLAALLAAAPAAGAAPALLPVPLGPDAPPAGAPPLDALFPDGLPHPFDALLDALRARVGPENVATALLPLGRSLQRFAAAPDYFASPRLVVAVTGDRAAGPGDPRLADRLFLGYLPAADVIEAISYNPAAGRFEFEEVVGYSTGAVPAPAERRVCLACHQAGGPIFSRPLWSETNANPAIAARLAPLGASFHGAPVRQTVDGLEAFDAATDRANRIALANWLWAQACPDPACRAALLTAALRLGLTGTGALRRPPSRRPPPRFPDGVAIVSPDLPNRDPLLGNDAGDSLQATGALDPETPRGPLLIWRPGPDGLATAAGRHRRRTLPRRPRLARRPPARPPRGAAPPPPRLPRHRRARSPAAAARPASPATGDGARLTGHVSADRPGRLTLALPGLPRQPDLALAPAAPPRVPGGRAADGSRIEALSVAPAGALTLGDDFAPLARALAAAAPQAPALAASGPFPRAALLTLIATLTGDGDG